MIQTFPYVTIAIESDTKQVTVVGFANTREGCEGHKNRTKATRLKTFAMSQAFPETLYKWLLENFVGRNDADQIMRRLSEEIEKMLETKGE